jgi:hypothetical protein
MMMDHTTDAEPIAQAMSQHFQSDIKLAVVTAVREVVSRYQEREDYEPVLGRYKVLDGLWAVMRALWAEAVTADPGGARAWAIRIVGNIASMGAVSRPH